MLALHSLHTRPPTCHQVPSEIQSMETRPAGMSSAVFINL